MSKLRRTLIASAALVFLFLNGRADATQKEEMFHPTSGKLACKFTRSTPGENKEFTEEYTDAYTRRAPTSTVHLDQWGNELKRTGPGAATFTPYNGWLPEQPMYGGLSGEHTYKAETATSRGFWKRSCHIAERSELTVAGGSFKKAWKVVCAVQRTDGTSRWYETS